MVSSPAEVGAFLAEPCNGVHSFFLMLKIVYHIVYFKKPLAGPLSAAGNSRYRSKCFKIIEIIE